MRRGKPDSAGLLVRLLCVLAISLAGFAHRAALAAPAPVGDLSAYALPDGSLPVLCLSQSGGSDGKTVPIDRCEFCRIASAIALPGVPTDFIACQASVPLAFAIGGEDGVLPDIYRANAPPRGPPAAAQTA